MYEPEPKKFLLRQNLRKVGELQMCKQGDIILVNQYQDHGNMLSRHSFVVIDDIGGKVRGLPFDFVALVMSSFKDEEQKQRKLGYPGNFPITASDKAMQPWANQKDGYIKAEQFYYFDKSKLHYSVIGALNQETFDLLLDFIEGLAARGIQIDQITDNL